MDASVILKYYPFPKARGVTRFFLVHFYTKNQGKRLPEDAKMVKKWSKMVKKW